MQKQGNMNKAKKQKMKNTREHNKCNNTKHAKQQKCKHKMQKQNAQTNIAKTTCPNTDAKHEMQKPSVKPNIFKNTKMREPFDLAFQPFLCLSSWPEQQCL